MIRARAYNVLWLFSAVFVFTAFPVFSLEVEITHQPGAIDLFIASDAPVLTWTDSLVVPEVAGCEPHSTPGVPVLPVKHFTLAIPPDADAASVAVSVEVLETEVMALPQGKRVQPGPPVAYWDGTRSVEVWDNPDDIVDGFDMSIYGVDAFYPEVHAANVSTGRMRKWHAASFSFYPVRYNPISETLEVVRSARVRLSYGVSKSQVPQKMMEDTVLDSEAVELFDNIGLAAPWYPQPATKSGGEKDAYVIVTTDYILSMTDRLAYIEDLYKEAFNVITVTESRVYSSLEPRDYTDGGWGGGNSDMAAENLRAWLQANYLSLRMKYVLLVGDPRPDVGSLAMKVAYYFHHVRDDGSDQYFYTATDNYFAELTGNWDRNGNGVYGELPEDFGAGGIDTHFELMLGRIPVYYNDSNHIQNLNKIIVKTFNYKNALWIDTSE
jgi:hypothetical protein